MKAEMIEKYTGIQIADRLEGYQKEVYLANWEYMHVTYGDNVEFERLASQIMLCDETRDHLYKAPPAPVRYVPGTRPVLEKIVQSVCTDYMSDRDKILAILCYIRDLYIKVDGEDFFYGGTEEDLIKKNEWFCERVSRLMVGLCEIAGFPGRIIMHVAAGHLTTEIHFEDKWGYIDPRCGLFYLDAEGRFMSVEEILRDRDRIYKQKDWVKSFHSPYWSIEFREHRNYHFCFSPLEIQCFGDYSLMDSVKYHFGWVSHNKAIEDGKWVTKRYHELGLMALIQ